MSDLTVVRLADYSDSAGSWSPEECVAHMKKMMETGEVTPVQLMIIYREENKHPAYFSAGRGSPFEKIGIIQSVLRKFIMDIKE